MSATKIRWGDTLDEDDSLPSNSIVGPDKSGVVTKTTYSRNDKGDIVKSVVKTRVSRVEKKIYAVRLAQAVVVYCTNACYDNNSIMREIFSANRYIVHCSKLHA